MLKVDSVQLTYNNRKILQDIYLECLPAQVVGLLGRNGCGKSSLLKIIFGTVSPQYKHVSVNGDVLQKGYLQNRIAYLPQHPYLPDNIRIEQLAKMLVEPKIWDEFAQSAIYANNYRKTASQLSGGERRQLEMLMILYAKADYILLDEPFTHISPIQAEELKILISKRAQHKGIILTDHQYQNILEVSDRIFLIRDGVSKLINDMEELVVYGYISQI